MRAFPIALLVLLLAGCATEGTTPEGESAPSPTPAVETGPRPFCEPSAHESLYTTSELLDEIEILKDSPREAAVCVVERVRERILTWSGAKYDNLTGDLNRETFGATGETWALRLTGDFGARPDLWHLSVHVADGLASVEGGLSAAGAVPAADVERARSLFETSPEGSEVRERAPHFSANATRWEPGQRIVLFYDSMREGTMGIPERAFARVHVDLAEGRVVRVERSPWR